MKFHVLAAVAALSLVSAINVAAAADITNSTLTSSNLTDVTNLGTITTGRIKGDAASVSISATGAIAQVSVSSVNGHDASCVCGSKVDSLTLSATNSGIINNNGSIETHSVTGVGTNVSVSALGAGASISVSNLNGKH